MFGLHLAPNVALTMLRPCTLNIERMKEENYLMHMKMNVGYSFGIISVLETCLTLDFQEKTLEIKN